VLIFRLSTINTDRRDAMNVSFGSGKDPVPVEIFHRDGQVDTHLNLERLQILDGAITGYSRTGLTLFRHRVEDLQGM
jgi:hypothetical protein